MVRLDFPPVFRDSNDLLRWGEREVLGACMDCFFIIIIIRRADSWLCRTQNECKTFVFSQTHHLRGWVACFLEHSPLPFCVPQSQDVLSPPPLDLFVFPIFFELPSNFLPFGPSSHFQFTTLPLFLKGTQDDFQVKEKNKKNVVPP
jgi:hypothetical protein